MRDRFSFDPRRIRISVVVLLAMAGVFGLGRYLRLNTTDSAPKGLYLVLPGSPEPGSWVAVCLPAEVARFARERGYVAGGTCPARTAPLLKRLAAAAGDRVELGPTGLRVNGRTLTGSSPRTHDSQGRPLPPAPYGTYRASADELWLASASPLGWDSRYFGPVGREGLLGVAHPLLVVGDPR